MKIDEDPATPTDSPSQATGARGTHPRHSALVGNNHSQPPTTSAIIVLDSPDARLNIAALTVLDRLVITLSRAGFDQITIVGDCEEFELARAGEMGIEARFDRRLPMVQGPVLVTSANVLTTPQDVREVLRRGGRLVSPNGGPLPLGVVNGLSPAWRAGLNDVVEVPATRFAATVTKDSAEQTEQAYWNSITSSSDGFVDRHLNRPAGRLLSRRLIATAISPNQMSVIATVVGLASAVLFANGGPTAAVVAAFVLQLSAILDCIDGDLARVLYKESWLGKWLDIVGDQVVHIAVFLGIAFGLYRSGMGASVLQLGSIAAVGVVLSFLVVLRALTRPEMRGQSRLRKLIDATTNRDFSVALILFSLFHVLDWFLWLAAIGSHVFWLTAGVLQFVETRSVRSHAQGN